MSSSSISGASLSQISFTIVIFSSSIIIVLSFKSFLIPQEIMMCHFIRKKHLNKNPLIFNLPRVLRQDNAGPTPLWPFAIRPWRFSDPWGDGKNGGPKKLTNLQISRGFPTGERCKIKKQGASHTTTFVFCLDVCLFCMGMEGPWPLLVFLLPNIDWQGRAEQLPDS